LSREYPLPPQKRHEIKGRKENFRKCLSRNSAIFAVCKNVRNLPPSLAVLPSLDPGPPPPPRGGWGGGRVEGILVFHLNIQPPIRHSDCHHTSLSRQHLSHPQHFAFFSLAFDLHKFLITFLSLFNVFNFQNFLLTIQVFPILCTHRASAPPSLLS
jgi:hypothetical protein